MRELHTSASIVVQHTPNRLFFHSKVCLIFKLYRWGCLLNNPLLLITCPLSYHYNLYLIPISSICLIASKTFYATTPHLADHKNYLLFFMNGFPLYNPGKIPFPPNSTGWRFYEWIFYLAYNPFIHRCVKENH